MVSVILSFVVKKKVNHGLRLTPRPIYRNNDALPRVVDPALRGMVWKKKEGSGPQSASRSGSIRAGTLNGRCPSGNGTKGE